LKRRKPDPLGAQTILREFGAAPAEAMLIGDSEVDVQTARNAGTFRRQRKLRFRRPRPRRPPRGYLSRSPHRPRSPSWEWPLSADLAIELTPIRNFPAKAFQPLPGMRFVQR